MGGQGGQKLIAVLPVFLSRGPANLPPTLLQLCSHPKRQENNKMFARPRPKKSALQPPPKKRKTTHSIEEITFDGSARADYLSGFHKRKLARVKEAQTIAAKKERDEKIRIRKQVGSAKPRRD